MASAVFNPYVSIVCVSLEYDGALPPTEEDGIKCTALRHLDPVAEYEIRGTYGIDPKSLVWVDGSMDDATKTRTDHFIMCNSVSSYSSNCHLLRLECTDGTPCTLARNFELTLSVLPDEMVVLGDIALG